MLEPEALGRALAVTCPAWPAWRRTGALRVVEQIESTNTALVSLAQARDRPERLLLGAHRQTAGRGRLGRRWVDEPGASLSVSLGLELPVALASLSGYTLVAGLAVRDALHDLGAPVSLKWPNDLVDGGTRRKCGGLLVEAQSVSGGSWVVVGLGLNLRPGEPARAFEATDLATLAGMDLDPNVVVAHWIATLEARTARFVRDGFRPFVHAFDAAHAYHHNDVELRHDGRVIAAGRFEGVGGRGEVLLRDATGVRQVHLAGDLSLRPIAP